MEIKETLVVMVVVMVIAPRMGTHGTGDEKHLSMSINSDKIRNRYMLGY
tara:strand:+ start:246 stop:392 length:147 start_codon:yes stop_codon:yes gene_type:complete